MRGERSGLRLFEPRSAFRETVREFAPLIVVRIPFGFRSNNVRMLVGRLEPAAPIVVRRYNLARAVSKSLRREFRRAPESGQSKTRVKATKLVMVRLLARCDNRPDACVGVSPLWRMGRAYLGPKHLILRVRSSAQEFIDLPAALDQRKDLCVRMVWRSDRQSPNGGGWNPFDPGHSLAASHYFSDFAPLTIICGLVFAIVVGWAELIHRVDDESRIMALDHRRGRIVKRGDKPSRQSRAERTDDAGMPQGVGDCLRW